MRLSQIPTTREVETAAHFNAGRLFDAIVNGSFVRAELRMLLEDTGSREELRKLDRRLMFLEYRADLRTRKSNELVRRLQAAMVGETIAPGQFARIHRTHACASVVGPRVTVLEYLSNDEVRVQSGTENHVISCLDVDLRTQAEVEMNARNTPSLTAEDEDADRED